MGSTTSAAFTARVLLAAGVLVCAVAMVGPFQGLERALVPWDKAAHFIAFYGLTALTVVAFPRRRRLDLTLWVILLGVATEFGQGLTGRDAEFADMAANALGALAVLGPMQLDRLRSSRPERRRGLRAGVLDPLGAATQAVAD